MTTDFDVLEDMLVKDWDVAYSFGIRYKHLMINPQGMQETDEDIDHILGVQSGEEGSGDEDVDNGGSNDQDEENVDEDDSEDDMGHGSLTGQYLQASGYTNAPQYPHPHHTPGPPPKQQKSRSEKGNKHGIDLPMRPQPPSRLNESQQSYNHPYPYGPPLDPWGRPMPYGGAEGYGYGGYGMHARYGGYAPPLDRNGRYPSQPPPGYNDMPYPPRHAMTPAPSQPDTERTERKRTHDSPFGVGNKRMRGGYEQSPFYMGRPHGPGYFHGPQADVKQESPEFEIRGERRDMSVEEGAAPTTELGEDSSASALEAELRATELELKVARLQAKRAALGQQSKAK